MRSAPTTRPSRLGAGLLAAVLALGSLPAAPVALAQDATGTLEVETIGGLVPDVTARCEGTHPDAGTVVVPFAGRASMALPAGSCDLTWIEPTGETNGLRVAVAAGRTTWVRGALLTAPWSGGRRLVVRDLAGVTIWDDAADADDRIWVLPGLYTVGDGSTWTLEVQALPGRMTLAGVSVARPAPSTAPRPTPTPTPLPTPRPTPTLRPTTTRVPDLVGLELADAGALARRFGLRLAVTLQETTAVDPGIVLEQTPRAGTGAVQGDIVRVVASRAAQRVAVPDVTFLTEEDAITVLLDAGLTPGRRTTRTNVDVPEGRVIATIPAPGTLVAPGTTVAWIASSGPPAGATPHPTPTFTTPPLVTPSPTTTPTQRPTPRPTRTPRPTPAPTQTPRPTPSPSPTPTPVASPSAALVEVPDLAGLEQGLAEEVLTASGLQVGRVQPRANRRVPAGQVIRTVPAAGELVAEGTRVRLIVSTGAPVETATPSVAPTREPLATPSPSPVPTPSGSPVPGSSAIPGAHLAAVQEAGVLRVNLPPEGTAWSRTNDDGEPAGFEAQVARRIGRELGVQVEFTTLPDEGVLDGSTLGEWDLAMGRLPAVDPVTGAWLLTQPYAWDPLAVAVAAAAAPAPGDLSGLAVCVVDGSAAESWLEGTAQLTDPDGLPVVPPVVVTLPVATAEECAAVLAAGGADAWIEGRPTLDAAASTDPAIAVGDATLAVVPIAAVVEPAGTPDTSLADAVDAAITGLRDAGVLLRLSQRAFDEDLVTGPPVAVTPGGSPGIPDASPEPSPIAATDPGRS